MKIALIGYGNMGREVEKLLNTGGKHQVISVSYRNIKDKLDTEGIKKSDAAIDFTSPDAVVSNIRTISGLGINMVIGTTGWYKDMNKVKKIVSDAKLGLIYGQNFSIGANLFFRIVENASVAISKFDYDVYGFEIHHRGKKDSPSGTAKKLSETVINNFPQKKSAQFEKLDRQVGQNELHFASIRGGSNPGMHTIIFDSPADEIKLTHQAHGRQGFAQGAIMAAEFISGKKGFYSFDDLFKK